MSFYFSPFSSNKDHNQFLNRLNNGNDVGSKNASPNCSLLPSKPSDRLQQLSPVLPQSALPSSSWQTTTTWLRSSPFSVDSTDGGTSGVTTTTAASVAVAERAAEVAEQRRKLLIELSAHKSRLVELHLRRDEVEREVGVCRLLSRSIPTYVLV